MSEELNFFLKDLINLLQEKYNESLSEAGEESDSDRSYRLGVNFAYYDALDMIESQLDSFGIDKSEIGMITPKIGQKI